MRSKGTAGLALCLLGIGALGAASAQEQEKKRPDNVFVAIYERGPVWIADKSPLEQPAVPEHVQHIRDLGELLIGAAPFTLAPLPTEEETVGMVVLFAESEEEARFWLDHDPAIQGKVMTAKLHRWHVDGLQGCF